MTVPLDAAIDEWGRSSEQSVVFFRRDTTRPMSPLLQAYSPYSEMLPQTFEPITFLTKDRSTITYFHFSEPVAFLNFSRSVFLFIFFFAFCFDFKFILSLFLPSIVCVWSLSALPSHL